MSKLVQVASVSELSAGEGKVVDAEGQSIALFNLDGTLSAIDNTCTHVSGPLGEGAPRHGLEQAANSPQKTANSKTGGAESGAVGARNGPNDTVLAQVIDAWPKLPADVKQTILTLVDSVSGE